MTFAHTFGALQPNDLTTGQKLVLAVVGTFTDKTGKCWPSIATIAARCAMSVRTVQKHISALVNMGYLVRIYRAGRSAVTRLLLRATPANNAPLPPQTTHPEPVIESINEITAPAKKIDTGAAVAAIIVFESENAGTPDVATVPDVATIQDVAITPDVATIPDVAITPDVATVPINPLHDVPDDPILIAQICHQLVTKSPIDPLQDVPDDLLNDFGVVRKNKKKSATITRTEASLLSIEASKAGLTMAQAITTCVLRGWSRFEASWLPPVATQQAPQRVFVPEMALPATPEVIATGKAALAAIRNAAVSNDPLAWAKRCIERVKGGEHVSHIAIRNACSALGIDHRTISKG